MASDKTLILMDTNKIRSILMGSPRYDSFEFGKEFNELKSFLDENNLSSSVTIAITEMTLMELLRQKKKVYEEDISNLKLAVTRLNNLDNVTIPEMTLPDDSFDCTSYLNPKVRTFLQENKIELISIEPDKKSSIFDVLINKVIEIKPPFKPGRNSSCSGHGFKDAVIWESFKQSSLIMEYTNIILFTSDSDFDGCEKEIEDINFKIIKSKDFLIEDLKSKYAHELLEKKYDGITKNEYLLSNLKQMIALETNNTPENVNITSLTEKIVDNVADLKELFNYLTEDDGYFEDMVCFVSKVKVNETNYIVNTLIDLGANEIETIQVEGIE